MPRARVSARARCRKKCVCVCPASCIAPHPVYIPDSLILFFFYLHEMQRAGKEGREKWEEFSVNIRGTCDIIHYFKVKHTHKFSLLLLFFVRYAFAIVIYEIFRYLFCRFLIALLFIRMRKGSINHPLRISSDESGSSLANFSNQRRHLLSKGARKYLNFYFKLIFL